MPDVRTPHRYCLKKIQYAIVIRSLKMKSLFLVSALFLSGCNSHVIELAEGTVITGKVINLGDSLFIKPTAIFGDISSGNKALLLKECMFSANYEIPNQFKEVIYSCSSSNDSEVINLSSSDIGTVVSLNMTIKMTLNEESKLIF